MGHPMGLSVYELDKSQSLTEVNRGDTRMYLC